eukprot:m.70362 g.70362  ORF g.70362 m.70362 type:complete len:407 (-) comp14289_c0_seq1:268-1488(-)
MQNNKEEHLLSLKVMRLTKPRITLHHPLSSEPMDIPGDTLQPLMPPTISGSEEFQLGEVLMLPSTFGNIYLGETFSCYICIHNDSKETAQRVDFKAELKAGTQVVGLARHKTIAPVPMIADQSLDDVVSHEVKELGEHMLTCTVNYLNAAGESKMFRKFYRFQVNRPLEVKTKAYNFKMDVLMEADVQNQMPIPMYLQSVTLQPQACFELEDLNTIPKDAQANFVEGDNSVFGLSTYLNPMDTRRYLYRLKPKHKDQEAAARSATTVGRLDIVWRTTFGEMGRLQTSQLPRKPPSFTEVFFRVVRLPERIVCGVPFNAECEISNHGRRPVNVKLSADPSPTSGITFFNKSWVSVSDILPQTWRSVTVCLLALKSGIVPLNGLLLADADSYAPYELLDTPEMFVYAD